MRNYLMGLIYGGALAGIGLGTASYLLPQRIELSAAPASAPLPQAAPAAADPALVPEAAPIAEAAPATEPVPAPETTASPTAAPVLAPQPEPAPVTAPAPAPEPAQPAAPEPVIPEPVTPEPVNPDPVIPEIVAPLAAPSLRPLQAFAADFDGAGGKPLFAVVLIDTDNPSIDRAAAASLPFPVSFAIDPEAAHAPLAMSLYRAAGKEVILMPQSLPAGATASDVETAMSAYAAMLPESVAVLSAPQGGFQDDRALSSLVLPAIGAQGRGALLIDKGLNSAAQITQREGIPYALVSRVIDEGGESVPVMRRYLDRAVFSAAQDGAAIVMGSLQPDTLAALTEWAVEGRASDVTLAPISALMQAPQ